MRTQPACLLSGCLSYGLGMDGVMGRLPENACSWDPSCVPASHGVDTRVTDTKMGERSEA